MDTREEWTCPNCGERWELKVVRFNAVWRMAIVPQFRDGLWINLYAEDADRCPCCFPWVWVSKEDLAKA